MLPYLSCPNPVVQLDSFFFCMGFYNGAGLDVSRIGFATHRRVKAYQVPGNSKRRRSCRGGNSCAVEAGTNARPASRQAAAGSRAAWWCIENDRFYSKRNHKAFTCRAYRSTHTPGLHGVRDSMDGMCFIVGCITTFLLLFSRFLGIQGDFTYEQSVWCYCRCP